MFFRSVPIVLLVLLLIGCGSSSGVEPTTVSGGNITVPPGSVMYLRPSTVNAGSTIDLGTQGGFGTDVVCAVSGSSDAQGLHRCSLSITLLMNVDYWIYLDEAGRPSGVDYHDEFFVGSQKVPRTTQVCPPRGNCYFAGLFRVVNNDAKLQ
jgi:hypothetical protein